MSDGLRYFERITSAQPKIYAEVLKLKVQAKYHCSEEEALDKIATYAQTRLSEREDISSLRVTNPGLLCRLVVHRIGFDTDPTTRDETLSEAALAKI